MSLLARVEQATEELSKHEKLQGRQAQSSSLNQLRDETTYQMQQLLYEALSPAEIAEMIANDTGNAELEVRGALELVSRQIPVCNSNPDLKKECIQSVVDLVIGLGPIEGMLEDPEITEVMVNGHEKIFFEREGKLFPSAVKFSDDEQVRLVVDKILGPVGRRVDERNPMVSARLPQGHRINVVVSPIGVEGPYVTIRKFREKVYTLEELENIKTFDAGISTFLKWVIKGRKNLAVSGGTGSGKTTLLNALSLVIPKDERIITVEDAAELRFQEHPNLVRMEARPESIEGTGEITIRDMVTNALRMRPDRIIVGECRSEEALDMLQAMNTGHDGSMTTLHANSSKEVVTRLVMMVRFGSELPVSVIEQQIASALDLIVHVSRMRDGSRRLVEISECDFASEKISLNKIAYWDESSREYKWSIPHWFEDFAYFQRLDDEEVEQWKSHLCMQ